jgi:hypothetical protein
MRIRAKRTPYLLRNCFLLHHRNRLKIRLLINRGRITPGIPRHHVNVKMQHMLARIQSIVLKDVHARCTKSANQRPPQRCRLRVNPRNDTQGQINNRRRMSRRNDQQGALLVLADIHKRQEMLRAPHYGTPPLPRNVIAESTRIMRGAHRRYLSHSCTGLKGPKWMIAQNPPMISTHTPKCSQIRRR